MEILLIFKMKKIPNPNGRKGCTEHQNLIEQIVNSILALGKNFRKERGFNVGNGDKRYADVVSLDENGNVDEIHQIGKQNQDGTPVKRERDAIADIEKATGKKVIFHPYNFFIGITISFILLTATMIYSHVTLGTPLAIFGL